MRPFFLRENVRSRASLVFLLGIVIIASFQILTRYHKHVGSHRHIERISRRETSDVFLLNSVYPVLSLWSMSTESHANNTEEDSIGAKESKFIITQQQRSLHIVYRLSRFSGTGRGFSRVSHLLVSLIGILGMFSAIVGALIGPWLADTSDDSVDEDRFAYWVSEEEDDEEDERICGFAREQKYAIHRILDVP